MLNLFRSVSRYIKINPNKTLNNLIPEFKKYINPIDITTLNNIPEKEVKTSVLFKTNEFELLKIDWGAKSSIIVYDNPQKGSLISLLNGNLIERHIDNIEIVDHLKSNNILYLQNKYGFHKLSNPNNINATSIILHSIK